MEDVCSIISYYIDDPIVFLNLSLVCRGAADGCRRHVEYKKWELAPMYIEMTIGPITHTYIPILYTARPTKRSDWYPIIKYTRLEFMLKFSYQKRSYVEVEDILLGNKYVTDTQ